MIKIDTKIKTHDKEYFYKYTTANIAKKIIGNLTARWSSPLLFNDPFDTQLKIRYDFEYPELVEPFKQELIKLILSKNKPKLNTEAEAYKIVNIYRKIRKKLTYKELESDLETSLKEGQNSFESDLEDYREEWGNYLLTFKIFCVAEECNDLLMWSHYTDKHSGVVFKFKCLPEFDTALCAATPVNYQTELPKIANLEEYVKHLTGQERIDMSKKTIEFIYTKSAHWRYEKEWRLYTIIDEENDQKYVDLEILPEEIDGLILGCKITEEDREEILQLLNEKGLHHTQVLQAKKNDHRFALDFDEIS